MESSTLLSKTPTSRDQDHPSTKNSTDYYRLFQTVCLGLANGVLGLTMGIEGTTYLDLLLITGSDLQKGSLIFTICGVGSIIGSISAGPLCDRFSTTLMLAWSVLGAGLCIMIVPWFPSLIGVLASVFTAWIFLGVLEAAIPLRVVELWKTEDAPYTHVIYLSLAIGGIIGPLLSEPFLSPWTSLTTSNESAAVNSSVHFNDSRIYIPYFIAGLCYELTAVLWIVIYLKDRNGDSSTENDDDSESSDDDKKTDLSGCHHVMILLCLGIFFMFCDGIEDSSDSFMMTFLVAQFGWSKSNAAGALTVFWVGYTVGKVVAVGVSRVISPYRLTVTCVLGTNATLVLWIIVSSVHKYSEVSWLLAGLIGFFIAPTFAACLTFTNAYRAGVSSNVIGWIMTCADIGNTLTPLLMGYLLQNTIPLSYLYTLQAEAVVCLGIMVIVAVVTRSKRNSGES